MAVVGLPAASRPECEQRGVAGRAISSRAVAGGVEAGLVDVLDARVEVGDDDALRALLDRQRELAQLFLGRLARGDVERDPDHRRPAVELHPPPVHLDLDRPAVAADPGKGVVRVRDLAFDPPPQELDHPCAVGRRHLVTDLDARDVILRRGKPEDRRERTIDVPVTPVLDDVDAGERLLDQAAESLLALAQSALGRGAPGNVARDEIRQPRALVLDDTEGDADIDQRAVGASPARLDMTRARIRVARRVRRRLRRAFGHPVAQSKVRSVPGLVLQQGGKRGVRLDHPAVLADDDDRVGRLVDQNPAQHPFLAARALGLLALGDVHQEPVPDGGSPGLPGRARPTRNPALSGRRVQVAELPLPVTALPRRFLHQREHGADVVGMDPVDHRRRIAAHRFHREPQRVDDRRRRVGHGEAGVRLPAKRDQHARNAARDRLHLLAQFPVVTLDGPVVPRVEKYRDDHERDHGRARVPGEVARVDRRRRGGVDGERDTSRGDDRRREHQRQCPAAQRRGHPLAATEARGPAGRGGVRPPGAHGRSRQRRGTRPGRHR